MQKSQKEQLPFVTFALFVVGTLYSLTPPNRRLMRHESDAYFGRRFYLGLKPIPGKIIFAETRRMTSNKE